MYFFGNCQTGFLADALAAAGMKVVSRFLASPATWNSSPGVVPPELAAALARHGVEEHLHGRSLDNQFKLLRDADPEPEVAVFNLFHENEPLFSLRRGPVFYIDPAAWEASEGFEAWTRANCTLVKLDPGAYFSRFGKLLEDFRRDHPATRMLLVTRLSHLPGFGPSPYSYLRIWESAHAQALEALAPWAAEHEIDVMDMDRVLGGLWRKIEPRIEAHCPFLRFEDAEGGRVRVRRDLEHVGTMWGRLAAKVVRYAASGRVEYGPDERPVAAWARPHRPERLDRERAAALLSSGSNYDAARAVASFFFAPDPRHADLLAEAAAKMPVCHNLLHMIHRFALLWPHPALARWCDAHRELAARSTVNGPTFMARYLERVDAIRSLALAAA